MSRRRTAASRGRCAKVATGLRFDVKKFHETFSKICLVKVEGEHPWTCTCWRYRWRGSCVHVFAAQEFLGCTRWTLVPLPPIDHSPEGARPAATCRLESVHVGAYSISTGQVDVDSPELPEAVEVLEAEAEQHDVRALQAQDVLGLEGEAHLNLRGAPCRAV